MGEFLLGLFAILVLASILHDFDELEIEKKKLAQEQKKLNESLRAQREKSELERVRLRSLTSKLEREINNKNREEYLTLEQVVKSCGVVLVLAILIILFFRALYLS